MDLNIRQKSLKVYDGDDFVGTVKVHKDGVYFDFARNYIYPAGSLIEIAELVNSLPLKIDPTPKKG